MFTPIRLSQLAYQLISVLKKQVETRDGFSLMLNLEENDQVFRRLIHFLVVLTWLHEMQNIHWSSSNDQYLDLSSWCRDNKECISELGRELELPSELFDDAGLVFLGELLKSLQGELSRHSSRGSREVLVSSLIEQDLLGELYKVFLSDFQKKIGGVYHTPWEVVDFIITFTVMQQEEKMVQNVRRSLSHGDEDQIKAALNEFLEYRMIDPACGSGRFLMRAIPSLVRSYQVLIEASGQEENGSILRRYFNEMGLNGAEVIRYLPLHVVLRHLHGVDLDVDSLITCRLNVCMLTFMECIRIFPLADASKVFSFKDFLYLFKLSALNFHVGDALVGCPPTETMGCLQEIFLGSRYMELHRTLLDQVPVTETVRSELLALQERLVRQSEKHVLEKLDEENVDLSLLDVTHPLCWSMLNWRSQKGGFGTVIGNPPYFRIREVSRKNPQFRKIYEYLKTSTRWKRHFRAASDIYYYFMLLGLQLLHSGGKLGIIVGNYWIENDNADLLKKEILDNAKIEGLVHLVDRNVFENVNEDTCIFFFTKKDLRDVNPNNTFLNIVIKDLDLLKQLLNEVRSEESQRHLQDVCKLELVKNSQNGLVQVTTVQQHQLGTKKWILHARGSYPRSMRIDGSKILPLGDVKRSLIKEYTFLFAGNALNDVEEMVGLCQIGRGMQSGRNDVFRVKLVRNLDSDVALIYNPKHDLTVKIERSLLKKAVRNSFIRRYHFKDHEWIIFIPPGIDIEMFPLARDYLLQFEDRLRSRYEFKVGKCHWYEYSIYRNLHLQQATHYILAPYRAKSNVFSRNVDPVMVFDDCVVIRPKDNRLSLTRYLLGILNSSLMTSWFFLVGKRKGTLYELFSTVLTKIPVPHPEKDLVNAISVIVAELEELSRMQMTSSNNLASLNGVNAVDKEHELRNKESQLDALVFHSYDLSIRNMRNILEKIGYDENRIKLIESFMRC